MTTDEHGELRRIARERRMHFEVAPELVLRGAERKKVGFQIRLWAVHPRGTRPLPNCPKCWTLVEDLRRIAVHAMPGAERATVSVLEPFRPALYESRVVPGTDEVSLAIRLFHREGDERPVDACEEQCLKEIRCRLRALGIAEQ